MAPNGGGCSELFAGSDGQRLRLIGQCLVNIGIMRFEVFLSNLV